MTGPLLTVALKALAGVTLAVLAGAAALTGLAWLVDRRRQGR